MGSGFRAGFDSYILPASKTHIKGSAHYELLVREEGVWPRVISILILTPR